MPKPSTNRIEPGELHAEYLHGRAGQCHPEPQFRDLPPSGSARIVRLIQRGLLLRCPYCGQRGIIRYPFWIADCCPRCGYRFAPESGYFVGGYAINLVGAEIIGLVIIVIILLRSNLSLYEQEAIGIGAAILLPIVFFPWSRTLWMALDLTLQGDLHLEQEKQITRQSADKQSDNRS